MYREAIAEFQKANAISGKMEAAPAMTHALACLGARTEARRILDELIGKRQQMYVPALPIALVHLGLGQDNEAIEWLRGAFEERSCWLVYANVDPIFDVLRRNPAFQSLMAKLRQEQPGFIAA
jgi:serine/threonine-protein kinase